MPKKPVIAIVDDDQSVRAGTMDLIEAMGFTAETFQSAEDFLNSQELQRTSCLIADVQMPGMTGLELHDRLVKSGNAIPTILITAFPNEEEEDGRGIAYRCGWVSDQALQRQRIARVHPFRSRVRNG